MAGHIVEHKRIESIINENPNGVTAAYISKALDISEEFVVSYLSTFLESGHIKIELFGSEKVYKLSQQLSVDSLANLSSDCIIVCDEDLNIIRANSKFLDITGMKKEDVIGKEIVNHCAIIGSNPYLMQKIKKVREGKEYRGEISLPISGKENFFVVRIIPTLLGDGSHGTTLIMENITEQKELFNKLQKSEKELDLRNKISHVFLTTPDSQMYVKVLDIVQHSFESKYGIFGYIDQEGNLVAPSLTKGIWDECMLPDKDLIFRSDKWTGVIRTTITGKEIFISNKGFKVPEGHIPIKRCMAAPIVYHDCVIGLLMVANKDSDYDEDDKHLLETITKSLAPILHSRLQRELEETQKQKVEEELERYRTHLEHMVKERTEELKRSEEMYRTLTEQSLVGVLVIQDGKVVYANPKICEIGGYDLEDMLGKNSMDFVHPDDRFMVTENIRKRLEGKEHFSVYDYRGLRKDGEVRWLEVAATFVNYQGRPASLSTQVDITDRVTYKNLIKRKLEIEKVISSVSSLFISPENLDLAINESLEQIGKLCGCSRSYIFMMRENNTVMDNTHEWCTEGVEPQKENLQDLPTDMFPWWMKKLHRGEIIHITDVSLMPAEASGEKEILEMQDISSLIVLPFYVSGDMSGFVGMDNVVKTGSWSEEDIRNLGTLATLIGNVIERDQKEKALNIYSAELQSAYEELKSLDRMKNELIANLSHELRTPLTSISGHSSILDQGSLGELNEKQKRSITIILNSSVKLGNLIDSLLYLSNLLAGIMEPAMDLLLIENVISRTVETNLDDATKKQITISKKVEAGCPFVEADIPSLMRLIDILVGNAVKFTPEGGKISLSAYGEETYMHLEVQDTGIGVPKDKISKIFDSFYQVDGSATRKYGGNGLGLYVAKLIVEAHKGKIWIESEIGTGTTVHVLLPLRQGS